MPNVFVWFIICYANRIFLLIYVAKLSTEIDVKEYTQDSFKAQNFTSFSKYWAFLSKYLVFQIQCAKKLVFQIFDLKYRIFFLSKSKVSDRDTRFIWNTRFFVWNTRHFKNMWQLYSIFMTICKYALWWKTTPG